MSDNSTEARSPDKFVKRAPTLSTTTAMGTAGSSLGLVALYINQCLEANAMVVPSTEMIIVMLGLVVPVLDIVRRVLGVKLRAWAAKQGVSSIVLLIFLAACASDGTLAGKDKPLDRQATLEATCDAIKTADAAFHALVKAKPELVDANGLLVEMGIMRTIAPVCAPEFKGDVEDAMRVAVTALVQISTIMEDWQK